MLGMQGSTLQTKITATVSTVVAADGIFGSALEIASTGIGIILSLLLIAYWVRKDIRETRKGEMQKERHTLDMEIKEQAFQNLKNENQLLKKQLKDD